MILLPKLWVPDTRREAIVAGGPLLHRRDLSRRPSSIASPRKQRGFAWLTNSYRFGFKCDAAYFDGSDYLKVTGAISGQTDDKQGIFSYWFNVDALNEPIFYSDDLGGAGWHAISSFVTSGGDIQLALQYAGGWAVRMYSYSSGITAGTWYHALYSWDTSVGTSANYCYLNDVAQSLSPNESVDAAVAWSLQDNWWGGAFTGASPLLNGALAELYLNTTEAMAFSTESNRRKFRSATGKPVSLGATGSVPTGTAPLIYLHLDDGEAATNFKTNRSGATSFSEVGTLTTFGSSPSD